MTRLTADQVEAIPKQIHDYDNQLRMKTGCTLKQLARAASGVKSADAGIRDCRVAVIPVTAGLGTIEGFSEAVCAIAAHVGFQAYVTEKSDAAGLVEAYDSKADLVILADDNVYAAINLHNRRVADNSEATAVGYTAALGLIAGGLDQKEVLLIGAGRVGRKAAEALLAAKARLIVYDCDKARETALVTRLKEKSKTGIDCGVTLKQALSRSPLIFDASPGIDLIDADQLSKKSFAAAPGFPIGFTAAAVELLGTRLVHDPLQIGTAVMLFQAIA